MCKEKRKKEKKKRKKKEETRMTLGFHFSKHWTVKQHS